MLSPTPGQASRKPLKKAEGRSRITNGSDLLPGIDGRSNWARRFRDLLVIHTNDLGGIDECSEAERSIIRRAAALTCELENMEIRFALAFEQGEPVKPETLDLYARTASHLRRLFETLGLKRRPKVVEDLDLHTYLAKDQGPSPRVQADVVELEDEEAG